MGKGSKKKYVVNKRVVKIRQEGEQKPTKEVADMGIKDILRLLRTKGVDLNEESFREVLLRVREITSTKKVLNSGIDLDYLFELVKTINCIVLPVDKQIEVLEVDLRYFVNAIRSKYVARFLNFGLRVECDYNAIENRNLEVKLSWDKAYIKLYDKRTQECLFEFVNGKVENYSVDRLLDCYLNIDGLIETFVYEMGDSLEGQFSE